MGYAILATKKNVELQKLIRTLSQDTSLIYITEHAEVRMLERCIGIHEVYDVLREGNIERPWAANLEHDSLECRMERYVGGRHLVVLVALTDEAPDVVVVTTFDADEEF